MITDEGIRAAAGQGVPTPLPVSWVDKRDAPGPRPDYAFIDGLDSPQARNLLSQIGYDKSGWDYTKIGSDNQLGRYQFTSEKLEEYGIIVRGSHAAYGNDAVNRKNVWRPRTDSKAYYNQQIETLDEFLRTPRAQDGLAYQIIRDLYLQATKIGVITRNDSAEIVAGMLYVCWEIGVGKSPNKQNNTGTGAWAWRFAGIGAAGKYYNSGRYSVSVLSK